MRFLLVLSLFAAVFSSGSGSSGGEDNPKLPIVVIDVDDLLVDVGGRFQFSGEGSSDPEGGKDQDLEFFWTALNETVQVTFDDRCEDDLEQICDENSDDLCSEPAEQDCTTNDDCAVGNCGTNSTCEELQNQ